MRYTDWVVNERSFWDAGMAMEQGYCDMLTLRFPGSSAPHVVSDKGVSVKNY